MDVGNVNLLDKITEGRTLPDGFDSWALKTVGFDRRTKNGFLWPGPGEVTARYDLDAGNTTSCPLRNGDGLCVALDWAGMASSGRPAICLLLVAYRRGEAVGDEPGKLRVPQVAVVDSIDGAALVRDSGRGADLRGANLRGADLSSADLSSANLRYANLRYADLYGANLRYANLDGANLRYANLRYANLRYANLDGADLRYANLDGANLHDANLSRANLHYVKSRGVIVDGV